MADVGARIFINKKTLKNVARIRNPQSENPPKKTKNPQHTDYCRSPAQKLSGLPILVIVHETRNLCSRGGV